MTHTISRTLRSIAMLPLFAITAQLTDVPDASACGNAMRFVERGPSAAMAMEYFEEHAYVQATITAFDAHSKLRKNHTAYTTSTRKSLVRASLIAAISIVRLHGEDYQGERMNTLERIKAASTKSRHRGTLDKDVIKNRTGLETREDRLSWAHDALAWHHQQNPEDLTIAVYYAEALARSEEPDDLKEAYITLSTAAELDLMPDAHAWATLAALQRLIDVEDAQAVTSCQHIGSFDACASLSLSLSEVPSYASHGLPSKAFRYEKYDRRIPRGGLLGW